MKVLIINGPNLNLLGLRETDVYGTETLGDIENWLLDSVGSNEHEIDWYQSNHEGEIIDKIHICKNYNGMIINAGALTHTSIAIHDALKIVKIPKIEVHISNIYNREEFRKNSFISPVVNGIIAGFGTQVYQIAINSLKYL